MRMHIQMEIQRWHKYCEIWVVMKKYKSCSLHIFVFFQCMTRDTDYLNQTLDYSDERKEKRGSLYSLAFLFIDMFLHLKIWPCNNTRSCPQLQAFAIYTSHVDVLSHFRNISFLISHSSSTSHVLVCIDKVIYFPFPFVGTSRL